MSDAPVKPFDEPYFIFGSADSIDTDVLVQVQTIGDRKTAYDRVMALRQVSPEGWNINLVVIEGGYITQTVTSNGTADGLNNALLQTYDNHLPRQLHPNPIKGPVRRNMALAMYRALRCMLTYCTRTKHRSIIKPHLKGIHPFHHKPAMMAQIDFESIDDFGNKYSKTTEIWKSLAFYLGQAVSLLEGVEIYTKADLIAHHPQLAPFILRQPLTRAHKAAFARTRDRWLALMAPLDFQNPSSGILTLDGDTIDMVAERSLTPHQLPQAAQQPIDPQETP